MGQTRTLPYLLLAPTFVLLAAIAFYPIVYAVDISLFRTEYLHKISFVGLANYSRLFTDPLFLAAAVVSVKFAFVSLLITIPVAMGIALLLNQPIAFKTAFRTVLIIPWALSQSVTGMLWLWVLNSSYGPVKFVLSQLGLPNVLFLASPDNALWIVTLVNSWMSYPLPMVLFLAALQGVPKELYEAAYIDGCGSWMSFWLITIPSIKATVMTTVIMMTLQYFNTVTLLYVMTGGGPLGTTRTLSMQVFLDGFFNFRLAGAAATGMIIFFLNIAFSLSYIRILRQSGAEPRGDA